jgi:hypothetical protein
MNLLIFYFVGVAVSLLFGVFLSLLFRKGLLSFLTVLFGEETQKKFWARVTYVLIFLSSISGALAQTYPQEAGGDRLVMIWSFMNQMEGMGLRVLWTLLVVFAVYLFAYAFSAKRK